MGDIPAADWAPVADDAAVRWAREQLAAPDATATPLRARPWSSTWRIRSASGTSFLKATGPAGRYEAPLMRQLAAVAPSLVPAVLGTDADHGWLLLQDAGTRRDQADRPGAEAWEVLLTRFARLQRLAEPLADELIAAGVPDERPHRLDVVLDRLLSHSRQLARLSPGARHSLERRPSRWRTELEILTGLPIPASVQHGDLHDGNVAVDAGGVFRFFDFGDATIAHPFMTMLMPLHLASVQGASPAQLARMRMAYLSGFAGLAPLPDLHRVLDAALRLAWLSRAGAWDRALATAPADHPWGDPVTETLGELLTALA